MDFGKEIATGNPYTLDSLADDIAYYNQIQEERRLYAEGLGGRSDDAILADPEFREKIAWWPKGMKHPTSINKYVKLVEYRSESSTHTAQYAQDCYSLKRVSVDFSNDINGNALFQRCFMLEELSLDLSRCTLVASVAETCHFLRNANIVTYAATNANYMFNGCSRVASITGLNFPFNSNYYNIFAGCNSLVHLELAGLKANLSTSSSPLLSVESVKCILDNCQHSDTAYTLTLHADVLARFMNKCTEGHEEYDAEYAASLASANSKGLTFA